MHSFQSMSLDCDQTTASFQSQTETSCDVPARPKATKKRGAAAIHDVTNTVLVKRVTLDSCTCWAAKQPSVALNFMHGKLAPKRKKTVTQL